MRSLRSRLLIVWLLSLAASVGVGTMLVGLYRQSTGAQLARASEAVTEACEAISDRFGYYTAGWAGPLPQPGTAEAADLRGDLGQLVAFALDGRPGLYGGIWQDDAPLVSSIPLAPSVLAAVASLAKGLDDDDRPAPARVETGGEAALVRVCPLRGPFANLSGFAVARLPDSPGQGRLFAGLGGLFVLAAGGTLLLGWTAFAWSRRVTGIEAALKQGDEGGLPYLAPTGERDLDRIVGALNQAGQRLSAARDEAQRLAARVAQSDRLAALGRVAAGVAHEVRNPVAAIRLRAENALAGDPARLRPALEAVLEQAARLEKLTGELLTMTQPRQPQPVPLHLAAFLAGIAADHGEAVHLAVTDAELLLDPALLRRALDELIRNALRHASQVTLRGGAAEGRLTLDVADDGPGVPPELRQTLFEPFVTGRPDGTGLGLAIAREMVQALGGQLSLLSLEEGGGPGAVFRLSLPAGEA